MPNAVDRNVLLGLLALKHDFVSYDQWTVAVKEWTNLKDRSVAKILIDNGALSEERCQLLETLVDDYLQNQASDQNQTAVGEISYTTLAPTNSRALKQVGTAEPAESDLKPVDRFGTQVETAESGDRPLRDETIIPSSDWLASGDSLSEKEKQNRRMASGAAMRFKILRPHAQGGLGKVSVARDQELNRDVALKEIRFQYADDESARARFVMEAEVTGGLEHPSIVPVYGLGCFSDGRPYYAMRFIKGDSLKDVVDRFHQAGQSASSDTQDGTNERTVELRRLLQRFIDVCQAIEYAHSRGVIHRDIKPANIMLGDYGETLVVDWGLAKPLGHKEIASSPDAESLADPVPSLIPASGSSVEATRMGSTIGTLQFMGPEQAAGRVDLVGPPTDIYSLGATLYYILTGRASVNGKTRGDLLKAVQAGDIAPPSTVVRGVSKSLDAVCMKAMALQPQDRYASAMALARDLERWLADEPVSVHRESRTDRLARWLRRNRAWFRAVAIATLAIITVLLVAVFLINGQRNVADQQRQLAEKLATEKSELADVETELRKKAEWQAASRSFEQSLVRCEQVDPAVGVLSLVQNLAEAQAIGAVDLEYSIRAQLGQWEGSLHTLDSTTKYGDAIHDLLQSPDGKSMLVATQSETVLIDVATGKRIGEPMVSGQAVSSIAFYPDGKRIITSGEDQMIRFWDATSAELIGEPLPIGEAIVALSLSSDQRSLAIATGSKIRLWDVETRQPTDVVFEHARNISAIEFCPNSSLLLAGGEDAEVRVWDVETKQEVGTPWAHDSPVVDIAISPDGKLAATCEFGNVARLWEISRGKSVGMPLAHHGWVEHVSFSADGKRVVTGCFDKLARVWDVETGALVGSPLRHPLIVSASQFDKSGAFIWTGSSDGALRRWRVANGRSQSLPLTQFANVVAVTLDDDAKTMQVAFNAIAAGTFVIPGEIQQWNVDDATPIGTLISSDRWRDIAAFSADGKRFATGTETTTAQIWSLPSGEPFGAAIECESAPKTLVFSNDGKLLLVGTEKGNVRVWDIEAGKPRGSELSLGATVSAAAFYPKDDRFLVGTWGQKASIHKVDREAGEKCIELPHENIVLNIGINQAETQYFTSDSEGGIRLWDAKTNERIGPVMSHDSRTTNAIFTPDGGVIVASYSDGSTLLWDTRTFDEIGPPLWHVKEVTALAQSKDGVWAATASADKTARLWKMGAAKGTLESVRRRYEALTGMRQLPDGSLETLTADQWIELKKLVDE